MPLGKSQIPKASNPGVSMTQNRQTNVPISGKEEQTHLLSASLFLSGPSADGRVPTHIGHPYSVTGTMLTFSEDTHTCAAK